MENSVPTEQVKGKGSHCCCAIINFHFLKEFSFVEYANRNEASHQLPQLGRMPLREINSRPRPKPDEVHKLVYILSVFFPFGMLPSIQFMC